MVIRLRRLILSLRYKFVPTADLITRIGAHATCSANLALIEVLKERLAHQDGSLEKLEWTGAQLDAALLSSCRLAFAGFNDASLTGAYFGYSDLRSATFNNANLRDAHFREAILASASFAGADLQGANFSRAGLQGASFAGANLNGANLWSADLRGADFRCADLSNCCLDAVLIDDTTYLPSGNHVTRESSAAIEAALRD